MLIVDEHLAIPEAELGWSFVRSSGAGGQNVNKVNSKAVLRFDVMSSPSLREGVRLRFLAAFANRTTSEGVLVLSCDVHRDQGRNVEECRARLQSMLRSVLHPPRARRATRPTRGSQERRLKGKSQHADKKRGRGRVGFDD